MTDNAPTALVVNPWIRPSFSGGDDEPAEPPVRNAPEPPPASGPTAPLGAVPVPDWDDRLPRRESTAAALLWWVGAHGGAGESTLAALLPESRSAGHAWPVARDPASERVPAVLVARTSMRGLRAAQHAAADWASGSIADVELLGLALIADAPTKLSRSLREFASMVSGGVPRVWWLPWCESWREGDYPTLESSPRQARHLVRDVQTLTAERRAAAPAPLGGVTSCSAP